MLYALRFNNQFHAFVRPYPSLRGPCSVWDITWMSADWWHSGWWHSVKLKGLPKEGSSFQSSNAHSNNLNTNWFLWTLGSFPLRSGCCLTPIPFLRVLNPMRKTLSTMRKILSWKIYIYIYTYILIRLQSFCIL